MSPKHFVLAAAVAALARYLTGVVAKGPFAVMDRPDARSLHTVAVSRVGGVALAIAAAAGVAGAALTDVTTFPGTITWALVVATGTVFGCSVIEDVWGLSPVARFALQIVGAVLIVAGIANAGLQSLWNLPNWLLMTAAVTTIVWMANLFNFMDGTDGLAGGMSVFGFGTLAAVAALAGVEFVTTIAAIVASATLGFLLLNFPPARVFMGDAGSVTLGFLAAALSSVLVLRYGVSAFVPAVIFSPFLLDATTTLLRRLSRRERVWQPHRQHWYQRLVLAGWSHRQVLQLYFPLMIACGASAIVLHSIRAVEPAVVIAGVLALHTLIPMLVVSAERRVRGGQSYLRP